MRKGTVRAAAEELHVTEGAISQQLRLLEAQLHRKLFRRVGRGLTPHPDARDLAAQLTRSFEDIGRAATRLNGRGKTRHLRVASLPSVATRLIVPALPDFREAMPEIEVELSYVHEPTGAALAAADLLIVFADGTYRGPGRVHLALDGSVRPVCSPGYRKHLGEDVSAIDLLTANLLHDADHEAWKRWFGEAGAPSGAVLSGNVYADFGLVGVAALAGHGVALCPQRLIEHEIARGDLVFVSNLRTLVERSYCVVLPDNPTAEALLFVEWLRSKGWQ